MNIPVLSDQGVERLGSLLDGFVESFRRGVSVGTEDLVLSQEKTLDGAHELINRSQQSSNSPER